MSRRKDLPEIKNGELVQPENVELNTEPADSNASIDEQSDTPVVLSEEDLKIAKDFVENRRREAKVIADFKAYTSSVKFVSNEPEAETVPDFETEVRQLEKEIDERIEKLNKLKGDTIIIRSKTSVDDFKSELNLKLSDKSKDIIDFIRSSGFPVSYVYELLLASTKRNHNLLHILDVAGVIPSTNMLEAHKSTDTHGVRFYLFEDDVFHLGREVKKVLTGAPSTISKIETELNEQTVNTKTASVDAPVSDAPVDAINPSHYGHTPGVDNPYEVIKIIEHFNLGFCIGNVIKYLLRSGKKEGNPPVQDHKKAAWYLNRHISQLESEK